MRRFLIAMSLASLAAGAGGCLVYHQPGRTSRAVVMQQPACHPSQYWDGAQCRHKGQGWGARKHDGR